MWLLHFLVMDGGTYESVHPSTWKHKTVEPVHAPHYSILEYVDPNKLDQLPENIKNAVMARKELEAQLATTNYSQNEGRMKELKLEIGELMKALKNLVPVNEWGNNTFVAEFQANNREMSGTQRKIMQLETALKSKPSGDRQLEKEIANLKKTLSDLHQRKLFLRTEATNKMKTVEKRTKLKSREEEYKNLENENNVLGKALDVHNENMKNAMGVLSIPYDKHRIFPSTGEAGLNEDIRALENADSDEAKAVMEEYDKNWKLDIDDGIMKRFINPGNDFQLVAGKKEYDYEAIWKSNFDKVIKAVELTKGMEMVSSNQTTGRKKPSLTPARPPPAEQDYLTRVHLSYAKKFMTTSIYFMKTPEAGYSRLMNLYIHECKLHMKNDFDTYKRGILQLLEANKQFGWITNNEVRDISKLHKLHDIEVLDASDIATMKRRANDWGSVEELIKLKSETSSNPMIPDVDPGSDPGLVCTTSTTQNTSASETSNCIIFSKKEDINTAAIESEQSSNRYFNEIGLPKPKINLPSDADTESIDSKRLTNYLINFHDKDIHSLRIKEAVVEFTSKNAFKMTGTPDEIAEAKALLIQENLDSHAEQIKLGTQLLIGDDANYISTKAVSKYKRVKVSPSKITTKLGKISEETVITRIPNRKILLAKEEVTSLRHGDYESLVLTGGSIGFDTSLSGITKLGRHIAQKVTRRFMTRFGSELLGKVAGPVGAISDIGMNIYSLKKSIQNLNDPNSAKFDRNKAMADIVADSTDIAVTSSYLEISRGYPPQSPILVEVAFVSFLRETLSVAFHKVVSHVDRGNTQISLLDYEGTSEYRGHFGQRDTGDFFHELIDFKNADEMAVSLTVPFLTNDTDIIGKVIPSRMLYQPKPPCWLEGKACKKVLHMIPVGCANWAWLSNCSGLGGYCEGGYSDFKCQNDSIFAVHIPMVGHVNVDLRCKCGDEPALQWGMEEMDSEVNFRHKQNVYLQRVAPDDTVPQGFSYLCKPSSLNGKGERVSLPSTETAYYCKGAIGFKRKNNQGKFMLYDLGNGSDSVYLDELETVDNMFVVKDGHKKFEGNAGDDTFLLDGPCSDLRGWLDGKGHKSQGNSLVLGSNCDSGGQLEVDLQSGFMTFGGSTMEVRNIQRVIGRQNESDIFRASCTTKLLVGPGGRNTSDPDEIYLPGSCSNETEITVGLEGSATMHASGFSGGKAFVVLQGNDLFFTAKVPPTMPSGTLLFKFQDSVGKLIDTWIDNGTTITIQLQFEGGGSASFEMSQVSALEKAACSKASGGNPIQILIEENSQFSRQLSFNPEPQGHLQAIHVLDRESGSRIQGYDFMDNVFHLRSGHWNVLGGRGRVNQFILKSFQFSGSIDGTSNGQNTLLISSDLQVSPIRINLSAGEISSSQGRITANNIQRLLGRPEYIEEVVVSCEVNYLELGGNAHDIVTISRSDCSSEIRIFAKGKLTVEDRKSSGTTVIEAGYFDQCSGRTGESLDLQIKNFGEGDTTLLLNYPISTITAGSPTFLNVGGDGGGRVVIKGDFPNVYLEEDYNTKSALILDGGKLLAFHELKVNESFQSVSKLRKGSKVIQNIFKLQNGRNWRVEGGNVGDVFSFVDGAFSGTVNGLGGRNQLFIGESIQGEVKVKQSKLLLNGQKALMLKSIQEIHGRAEQPEDVEVGCDTLHLALNGGSQERADRITIPDSFSSCNSKLKLTVLGVGITQLISRGRLEGKVDIYLSADANSQLQFKANIQVSPNLILNFPIQLPSYKLSSSHLNIRRADNSGTVEAVQLKIYLMDHDNFLDIALEGGYFPQNVNWMFVDKDFNSIGNIFIDVEANEIQVLHVLQKPEGAPQSKAVRKGAVGAKNIFRLHTGTWEAFGGALDDLFVLNEMRFEGQIHGLEGVNSLILADKLEASVIEVNIPKDSMSLIDKHDKKHDITVKSIQIVGGRNGKKEIVHCGCDTKLIMLEGGGVNTEGQDEIYIRDQPCAMEMAVTIVLKDFTRVENLARKGNFTYHVRADQSSSWDIRYIATAETSHTLKLEIGLDKVQNMSIVLEEESKSFEINLKDGATKKFPLNYQRPPTIQIGTDSELMADILFPAETMSQPSLRSSIIARTPFSGSIDGLHGVENGIDVHTSNSLEGIFGGEKDDDIYLSQVESILVINGGEGVNRLQLSDKLHRGHDMEIDFQLEKIMFIETQSDFVSVVKGINQFVGREHSFERVVMGCDTKSVKWAEEVSVRNWKCGYEVKIELGDSTRVMFEAMDSEKVVVADNEVLGENEIGEQVTVTVTDKTEQESNVILEDRVGAESYLEPSIFHYHFTSIRSFDIEVDSFKSLRDTRHIFYLNFALANLTSIRFSLNESRLIYSTFQDPSLEYSHLVGKLEDTATFYSQPEFMTKDGFLLRITRYGEVMAVMGAAEETFELDFIHNQVIPGMVSQLERLRISFMVEIAKDFIYTGSAQTEEVDILTNRENFTSHLIGWGNTTYEILGLQNDTWIYPQQSENQGSDSGHVIDLRSIISQIRSETGYKYVPEVKEKGAHLEIVMTNCTDKYPASVVIANGTEHAKNLVILLNSIAMEITPRHHESRRKRSLLDDGESEWKIIPRPISIPRGHTYVLSTEDLEDDVEIKSEGNDASNDTLVYGRDYPHLMITGFNTEENATSIGRFTSFVMFEYFESGVLFNIEKGNTGAYKMGFGKLKSIRNMKINMGKEAIEITSIATAPIVNKKTGEEVQVQEYEDVLDSVEEEILKEFPDVPRRFKVSPMRKIGRNPLFKYLVWGGFWGVTMSVGILIWVFCRKKNSEMEGDVYDVKKSQEKYDKSNKIRKQSETLSYLQAKITAYHLRNWIPSWKRVLGNDGKRLSSYEVCEENYETQESEEEPQDQGKLIPTMEWKDFNSLEENIKDYEEPLLISRNSLSDFNLEDVDWTKFKDYQN